METIFFLFIGIPTIFSIYSFARWICNIEERIEKESRILEDIEENDSCDDDHLIYKNSELDKNKQY